jgi:hypothetical protein
MSNYSIKMVNKEYTIIEKSTKNVVFTTTSKRNAHKKLAFYNMGGGFDGWTPSFFLTKMPELYFSEVE